MIIQWESERESHANIDLKGMATDPSDNPSIKSKDKIRIRSIRMEFLFKPFYLNG
jgi:hypothetical protein